MKASHSLNIYLNYCDGGLHKRYKITKELNKGLVTNAHMTKQCRVHKNTNFINKHMIKLNRIPTDKIMDKLQMTLYWAHKISNMIHNKNASEGRKVLSVGYKHCTWI